MALGREEAQDARREVVNVLGEIRVHGHDPEGAIQPSRSRVAELGDARDAQLATKGGRCRWRAFHARWKRGGVVGVGAEELRPVDFAQEELAAVRGAPASSREWNGPVRLDITGSEERLERLIWKGVPPRRIGRIDGLFLELLWRQKVRLHAVEAGRVVAAPRVLKAQARQRGRGGRADGVARFPRAHLCTLGVIETKVVAVGRELSHDVAELVRAHPRPGRLGHGQDEALAVVAQRVLVPAQLGLVAVRKARHVGEALRVLRAAWEGRPNPGGSKIPINIIIRWMLPRHGRMATDRNVSSSHIYGRIYEW